MGFPLPWPHGYVPTSTTVESTPLEYDASVLARGRARLLHQFRGKPRMEALVGVLLGPFQEIEIAAWQLLVERTLGVATFDQLHVLARTVGLRGYDSLDDGLLRRFVRAWVLVQRSAGTTENLIGVTRLFTGSEEIETQRYDIATIVVRYLEEQPYAESVLLGRLLRKAASAGVKLVYEYIPEGQGLDGTFTLADSLTADEASDALGLGGVGDVGVAGTEIGLSANALPGAEEIRPIAVAFPEDGPYFVRLNDGVGGLEVVEVLRSSATPYYRLVLSGTVEGTFAAGSATVALLTGVDEVGGLLAGATTGAEP